MKKIILFLMTLVPVTGHAIAPAALLALNHIGDVIIVGEWIYNHVEKVFYIEVEGIGQTADESRQNGLKLAVEEAVGSVIATESEVQNYQLHRDEIIAYSSGHVRDFEILSTKSEDGLIKTRMNVWVKRSTLADRLMNESEQVDQIQGQRVGAAFESQMQEKQQGDRVIDAVLRDFPKNAFLVEMEQTSFDMNYLRRPTMIIPITVSWAKEYLDAFEDAITTTAQIDHIDKCNGWLINMRKGSCNSATYINLIRPFQFRSSTIAGYTDPVKPNMVMRGMVGTAPAVLVTLTGTSNDVIYRECFQFMELDHNENTRPIGSAFVNIRGSMVEVNGNFVLKSKLLADITNIQVNEMTRVAVQIVRGSECPRR